MPSQIQSVIFDKDKFTPSSAKKWLEVHELISSKIDQKESTYNFKQSDPSNFKRFVTKQIKEGIKFVIGFTERSLQSLAKELLESTRVLHSEAKNGNYWSMSTKDMPIILVKSGGSYTRMVPTETDELGTGDTAGRITVSKSPTFMYNLKIHTIGNIFMMNDLTEDRVEELISNLHLPLSNDAEFYNRLGFNTDTRRVKTTN